MYTIQDEENGNYLHSDGSWFMLCPEWWPTREFAQAVLDKYQPPKPEHVWEHGDVFRRESGTVMVYLVIADVGPVVYLLTYAGPGKGMLDICLADATFICNIKDAVSMWESL